MLSSAPGLSGHAIAMLGGDSNKPMAACRQTTSLQKSLSKKASSALNRPASRSARPPLQCSALFFGCQARGNSGAVFASPRPAEPPAPPAHCHQPWRSVFKSHRFSTLLKEAFYSGVRVLGGEFNLIRSAAVSTSGLGFAEGSEAVHVASGAKSLLSVSEEQEKCEKQAQRIPQLSSLPSLEGEGGSEEIFYDCLEGGGEEEGEIFYDCLEGGGEGNEESEEERVPEVTTQSPIDESHEDGGLVGCPECEASRLRANRILEICFWILRMVNFIMLLVGILTFLIRLIRWLLGILGVTKPYNF